MLDGTPEPPLSPDEKRQRLWDAVVGRLATAVVSGVILGGAFVWVSSGLSGSPKGQEMRTVMSDYRSPKDAYYRPFLWGFVIGAAGALVTGAVVYDPTDRKR